MPDLNTIRTNMVEGQIRPANIRDGRIIQAMSIIPRERFVCAQMAALAYMDDDVPVSEHPGARALMEPRTLARLIDLAGVRAGDLVLDIGCMSGYSAAILSSLCEAVVALEPDEALAGKAIKLLAELDISNVAVVKGPLERGYPEQGPYDVIILDGATYAPPAQLFSQLKGGGRLACVVNEGHLGRAHLYTRSGNKTGLRIGFDAAIPSLPGFEPRPVFHF
jgi:protein-L-isoaspartate(D-aspartate) O-methyltransferase